MYDPASYQPLLSEALERLSGVAGRPIRIEIEPGRFPVAGAFSIPQQLWPAARIRPPTSVSPISGPKKMPLRLGGQQVDATVTWTLTPIR